MIVPQYIEPDYWDLFREDAVVTVEERSETEGVIVDSRSFGKGLPVPQLGDNVRLPDPESTWRKASFAPRLRGTSLTDPSELIIVAHAGRRLITSDGMPGTVIDWTLKSVHALMDDGIERVLEPYLVTGKVERGWEFLTRSESCRVCHRPISIYTPFLICGACADARGEQ